MKLSVLIATMPERRSQVQSLMDLLHDQYTGDEVEYITVCCCKTVIGKKRNVLLSAASGEYITFIDDDDQISSDYISKILTAIESGPDCIGISGTITTNGQNERQWHISKDFLMWFERGNVYYRTPNHISPVKRVLALQAGFPDIAHGEDYEYSMRLLPLLKTETKIEGNIYKYQYQVK